MFSLNILILLKVIGLFDPRYYEQAWSLLSPSLGTWGSVPLDLEQPPWLGNHGNNISLSVVKSFQGSIFPPSLFFPQTSCREYPVDVATRKYGSSYSKSNLIQLLHLLILWPLIFPFYFPTSEKQMQRNLGRNNSRSAPWRESCIEKCPACSLLSFSG